MKDTDLVSVRNRNNGYTGYTLQDRNIWRNFAPGEVKKVPLEELRQVQYNPGGDYILSNLLVIENEEALKDLNMTVEPEYNYTENDVKNLLFNGTIEQLQDFLDFAPAGAIELCKEIAVKEEVPDTRKRKIISEVTGFSIDSAINVNHIMAEDEQEKKEEKKERRVAVTPAEEPATKQRRTSVPATSKYKVVSTNK